MRIAAAVVLALVATGCSSQVVGDDEGTAIPDQLEISVTVGDGPTKVSTLECSPPGGTLHRPALACVRLEHLHHPFAPVPKNIACTAIYGGPQVAEVHGTFRGKRVDARFARTNGCEIARWNKVRFLFPSG